MSIGNTPISFSATASTSGLSLSEKLGKWSQKLSLNLVERSVSYNIGIKEPLPLNSQYAGVEVGYSGNITLKLNNIYNATVGVDLYTTDISSSNADAEVNIKHGYCIEMNTWAATAIIVVAVVLIATPIDEIAVPGIAIMTKVAESLRDWMPKIPSPVGAK